MSNYPKIRAETLLLHTLPGLWTLLAKVDTDQDDVEDVNDIIMSDVGG